MLTKLDRRTEELGESFNKDLESIVKNQADPNNIITQMKTTTTTTLEGINSRLANIEE